jgi:molybdate transport system substrate-binding protein
MECVVRRCRRLGGGARAVAALLLALAAPALHALELRVLSAGAVEPGMRPALAAFERESGHTVRIDFAAAPALRAALRAAPVADVVVVPQGVVDELAATGAAGAGPRAPVGRVGVGVAVRPGVAAPDVASAEGLRAALIGADVVVYNRASTGVYVEALLQRLGVADVVGAKSERLADGASVMRRLLAGTAPREFGFGAMTEIALFADQGLRLVGPLPALLQNYTTYVALPWPGVKPEDPARADAVAALMRSLQAAPARSLFAHAGIEPAP